MSDIKASFSGGRGERGERGKRGHRGATGPTGPGGSAEFPTEFTSPPVMNTIFVRTTGSDSNDGLSPATALRTLQFAVTKVPFFIPAGQIFRIDITGIDELLPPDYALPAWKCPDIAIFTLPNPYAIYQVPIEIFATPQPVAAIPLADTIINATDVAAVTIDPLTKLQTVVLNVPRASWTPANLVGKQVVDAATAVFDGVIAEVTSNTTILVSSGSVFGGGFTFPLNIAEPSAHLHGSATNLGTILALNIDCIGFTGISITSDNGFNGLYADGSGMCVTQFCNLDAPLMAQTSGSVTFSAQNRINFCHVFNQPTISGTTLIVLSFFDATNPVTVFGIPLFSTPTILTITDSIFIGCDPIEILTFGPGGFLDAGVVPHVFMRSILIKDGLADGFVFHGGKGLAINIDSSANAGNGITVDNGAGVLELQNVGSSVPNGGFGIAITDGMQVIADVATTTTNPGVGLALTGASGDISLGSISPLPGGWAAVAAPPNNVVDVTNPGATLARIAQE